MACLTAHVDHARWREARIRSARKRAYGIAAGNLAVDNQCFIAMPVSIAQASSNMENQRQGAAVRRNLASISLAMASIVAGNSTPRLLRRRQHLHRRRQTRSPQHNRFTTLAIA